ncbi:MAG: N-methyl-L-tryptophan oxidase [Planctomycetaceae bacterium]
MERFDVVVVGTGGMGAAAASHLARLNVRVLGLDRFPVAHDRGSSHGQTRLIRLAYYEHPDYVPLLRRAYDLWRDLEHEAGRTLLVESGLVMAGPPGCDLVAGAERSAGLHGLDLERLAPAEARRRWPAFTMPDDWEAVHEARGGYLSVEECVRAHADAALRAGAELRHGVTVRGWRADGGSLVVDTDRGPVAAGRLVLCPGAWAADLLRLPAIRLRVLRKSLFWYEPAPAGRAAHAAGTLPCFAFDAPGGFFYGFPAIDGRGVKVAEHTGGRDVADPLTVDRGIDDAERRAIESFLGAHLPGACGRLSDHVACLYTMSPDSHFVLGLHPDEPRVAIAAGFSGHGFKFASVVGEVLAHLLLDGRSRHPIGFLSPDRPLPASWRLKNRGVR